MIMAPTQFIESTCDAARNILDRFGAEKATGYVIGEQLRVLGEHHRAVPLTPTLSPSGRGRPARTAATPAPLGEGLHRPLLPAGEKVPEGRMRGRPAGCRGRALPGRCPALYCCGPFGTKSPTRRGGC